MTAPLTTGPVPEQTAHAQSALEPNTPPSDRTRATRRARVPIQAQTTDAVFLVLRRLRGPLVLLIIIFAVTVAGLSLMPGVDPNGNPHRLTVFEAFYVMSYTATTIGFGELPYPYTTAQRMWMTFSIFLTVSGWAYTLSTAFQVLQDNAFRRAINLQRFRRRVSRLREPFFLVIGYGQAGRSLSAALDRADRRLVVVDEDQARIDVLAGDDLMGEVPAIAADPSNPSVLGLAGLGHPQCEGLLIMTDEDETNLAALMTARLLRPDLTVIARCRERRNAETMAAFSPTAIINPFDRYGTYLIKALTDPVTYQLTQWLIQPPESPMPELLRGMREGRWVIVSDGHFGDEVAADLSSVGLEVSMVDPADGQPDLDGAVGVVVGAESDITNLAIGARARKDYPGIFLALRQRSIDTTALVDVIDPQTVFASTNLVAYEALARVEAPDFWSFIVHANGQDDAWSVPVLHQMVRRLGRRTPRAEAMTVGPRDTPGLDLFLRRGGSITLDQLLHDPDDRETPIPVFPSVLIRDDEDGEPERHFVPPLDIHVRIGDQLGLLVARDGWELLQASVASPTTCTYLATGEDLPATWLGRWMVHRWPKLGR